MKILGLDSSTTAASVAVTDNDRLVCEMVLNDKLTHSQKLLPLVDKALKEASIGIDEIDAFAAVTGPGSFTGLRIGVATIKGLAACGNKPVASVNTLCALAMNFPFSKSLVCSMLDARAGRVFANICDTSSGRCVEIQKTDLYDISDLVKIINEKNSPVILTGDGAVANESVIKNEISGEFNIAPSHLVIPRASAACRIAAAENKFISYSDLIPEYYRKSQVEQEVNK